MRSTEILGVVTVGFPFCAFKVLTGKAAFERLPAPWGAVVGGSLLTLGALDLVINVVDLVFLAFRGNRIASTCTLTLAASLFRHGWKELGTSLDVMLSFTLVAIMVGGGFFRGFDRASLALWDVSVVFNVLGAGLNRIVGSLGNLRQS